MTVKHNPPARNRREWEGVILINKMSRKLMNFQKSNSIGEISYNLESAEISFQLNIKNDY